MPTETKIIAPPSADTLKACDPSTYARVFNKSTRTFMHHGFKAMPNTFVKVPPQLAEFWMDRYPELIVEAGQAVKELGGANARIAEIQAKLDEANRKIALLEATPKDQRQQKALLDLTQQLADAGVKIKKLTEDNEELVAQLEKATAPAAKAGADSV
jgi:hypothetical protein